jgi:hypothetical protein
VLVLLAATTATSLAALPLAMAVAIPRVRWKTVEAPEIVEASGDTWRRLRGPAVVVTVDGARDVALPAIDAQDRWILVGLLSGRPIPGLAEAPATAATPGGPRICRAEGEACRAWPASWPDPSSALPASTFTWSRRGASTAIAYDRDAGLFLQDVKDPSDDAPPSTSDDALEIQGRVTDGPRRDGPSALFVVRRVSGGRMRAARVIAVPTAGGHDFDLQRADVALDAGRQVLRYVARPALVVTSLALPAGVLAYLLAPLLLAARRRGASAPSSRGDAYAWLSRHASPVATFAAGVAAAAPAVVALASLWASR